MQHYDKEINMYDPSRDYKKYQSEYDNAINKVINHGGFINGPEVSEIENLLANYVGVKHCITVANGTDAIQIAMMALDVGSGDEVITVSHTWISTAEAIAIIGGIPVFVDIEKDTFNMDPSKFEAKISQKTKAILVVSLYGQMVEFDTINRIAEKYQLPVVEDAAQSFGAKYKGKRSCSLSKIATTSFFPTKPLGCYGDGGACFTNDDELAIKIRAIKNHGCLTRFNHLYIGMNSRLDTLQAAILLVKIKHLDEILENRNRVANYYHISLKELEKEGLIKLPITRPENYHVWAQYSILVKNRVVRDKLIYSLKDKNINVSIFYPKPLHTQKCFDYLGYREGNLPVTEDVCNRIINLPCYGEIVEEELLYICQTFTELVKSDS